VADALRIDLLARMMHDISMRSCVVALALVACNAQSPGGGSFDEDAAVDAPLADTSAADVTPDVAAADVRPVTDVAAPPPGDPAARDRAAVCSRWLADRPLRARTVWTAGADPCAPGTLSPEAHDDAMRTLNLYRWLAGVAPATADPALAAQQQACAVMMTVNSSLSHAPPSTWRCYAAAGAQAAGSSNLALGTATPAAAVDLYANERDQNLGHRRWVFSRTLGATWHGATTRASCMQTFRTVRSPTTLPAVVAWPNPGPAPMEAFGGVWHAQDGARSVAGATVTVRNEATGAELAVTAVAASGNYGNGPALAWRPSGWTPAEGTTYAVTLTYASGAPVTYRTTPVRCR